MPSANAVASVCWRTPCAARPLPRPRSNAVLCKNATAARVVLPPSQGRQARSCVVVPAADDGSFFYLKEFRVGNPKRPCGRHILATLARRVLHFMSVRIAILTFKRKRTGKKIKTIEFNEPNRTVYKPMFTRSEPSTPNQREGGLRFERGELFLKNITDD